MAVPCIFSICKTARISKSLPLVAIFMAVFFSACHVLRVPEPEPEQQTTDSGLTYTILREGEGPFPQDGDRVSVHYKARLSDGTMFDQTQDREEPVTFNMGTDDVIPGLEEGIMLLREGSFANLIIPPQLAYGEEGYGPVPGDETLTFELELLRVEKEADPKYEVPDTEPEVHPEDALAWQELPSGTSLAILEKGDGPELKEGKLVTLHYTGFLDDATGTVFDSSYQPDEPVSFILGRKMVIPGWEEALPGLRVGDRVKVLVPYEMAYGRAGRGPIPPETDLVFDIELLDAEDVPAPDPFPTEGKDTLKTESGLQYILVREGEGDMPPPGSVITVHYSGYLSDGSLFDSSVQRSEPLRFVLGSDQVLRGWDEAFSLLRENAKARLILPPHLAYGERGSGPIPPGETLIFDVEVIDIDK